MKVKEKRRWKKVEEAEYTAKLSDSADATTDLFGNPIVLVKTRQKKKKELPNVCVCFKIRQDEYDELRKIVDKFGMNISRYVRDAVRKTIAEHRCILFDEPYKPNSMI